MRGFTAAVFVGLAVFSSGSVLWAESEAPPAGNAIGNSNFEQTYDTPNLWNGVNPDSVLAGPVVSMRVLTEAGEISSQALPSGVAIADLNGDGRADILTTDALGYTRVYFNVGGEGDPRFEFGELSLPFLALPEGDWPWMPPDLSQEGHNEYGQWLNRWFQRRRGVRGALGDMTGNGVPDLVAGNYFGDILFVPNRGSGGAPGFVQPQPFGSAIVPTRKDRGQRWGNVFAPIVHDWNGDGLPDLLIGEGSYSANNIHLLLNQGAPGRPVFNEDKSQPLALGGGRQQLSPALADFNGDGRMDILVADRGGRIAVHLAEPNWSPGQQVPFSGYIARGGGLTKEAGQAAVLGGGITTLAAGDLTGNGLFDLVVARSDGEENKTTTSRLFFVRNEGTKEEPKFGEGQPLRGEIKGVPLRRQPSRWDADAGVSRGNFYGFAAVVGGDEDPAADPRAGSKVMKFGYEDSPNRIISRPSVIFPAQRGFNLLGKDKGDNVFLRDSAEERARGGPSNLYVLRQGGLRLRIDKNYTLSFEVKGARVRNERVILAWRGFRELGEDRLVRGERGAVDRQRNVISETMLNNFDFKTQAGWATVTRDIRINFDKQRALNKEEFTSEAALEISFELEPPGGVLYLDNVKLELKE